MFQQSILGSSNGGKTLFDNVHSVKQAFCECEIFFTNGRSIELIPEQSGCQLALALAGEQAGHLREQMRERLGNSCGRFPRQDLAQTPTGVRLQCRRVPGFNKPLEGANHSFQRVVPRSGDHLEKTVPPFVRYASRLLARLEKSANALDRGTFFVRVQLYLPNTFSGHNARNTPALLAARSRGRQKIET